MRETDLGINQRAKHAAIGPACLVERLEHRVFFSAVPAAVFPSIAKATPSIIHTRSISTGLPAGFSGADVGAVGLAGSTSQATGRYTVKGAGADIGGTGDGFQFAWTSLVGDGRIVARLASFSAGTGLAKAGIMLRGGTASNAINAFMALCFNGTSTFQARSTAGGLSPSQWTSGTFKPTWLKIVRAGSKLTGYRSPDGVTWTQQGSATLAVGSTLLAGLAVSSHNKTALATATFDSLTVTPGTGTTPPNPPPTTTFPGLPEAMKSNDGFLPLFNGVDLTGFYTWIDGQGKNNDPTSYFKVENGMIHVLGQSPTTKTLPFGYLATNNAYANYRLRFQYQWGINKFAPRNVAPWKRDSGLLTNITGPDRVWPTTLEVQVQEGDTGDFWLLDTGALASGTATVASTASSTKQYVESGIPFTQTGGRIVKSQTKDTLTGWNTVDVIVEDNTCVVMVNGTVVNRITNLTGPDGKAIAEGRIGFQAEGAEVWYRDIQIKPLATTPTNPPYSVLVLAKPNADSSAPAAEVSLALTQLKFLGSRNGFTVDVALDGSTWTDASLAKYRTVLFLETSGDAQLTDSAKAAFERYIAGGGGFAGIGAAPDVLPLPPVVPATTVTALPSAISGPALTLFNSASDTAIGALVDGQTVDLNVLGTRLNILATPQDIPGSISFSIDGALFHTENSAPFTLAGVTNGDYADWTPTAGSHVIQAAEYSGVDGTGDLLSTTTVVINVIAVTPPPPPAWAFIANLVGGRVSGRTGLSAELMKTIDRTSSATRSLPLTWTLQDASEQYAFDPSATFHDLLDIGTPGATAPISWTRESSGGRVFYTGLGATPTAWADPLFLTHVLGGIEYAANTSRLPPSGATVLFDGTDTAAWQKRVGGGPIGWTKSNGELLVQPGTGDIRSNATFTDFRLHLEFNVPAKPATVTEQDRGNSGVGLLGSYELQVLDSYGRTLADKNDVGAIYGIKDAAINAALPAGAWESYDILFKAPTWQNGVKTANARVTAWLNGILVQNDVEIPTSTFTFDAETPGGGPLILQDHANFVRYRNIWVVPS